MKEVSLRKCDEYIYEDVKSAIEKLLIDLGGLEKYIQKKSKVLIKLNLLSKKGPQECVTTHPMVFRVVAEKLLALGCEVIVGDSPGGTYTEKVLKGVYKTCGIEEVARELGVTLNYDTSDTTVHFEQGKILKQIEVITPITQVDYVVNICKLKTHVMATFTGGVKNLFGVVAGLKKAEYHFRMPDVKDFTEALVDICEYVQPTLTIMDGIIGMQGEGPSAGEVRKVGVLLGSGNPYALDVVACQVINLDPLKVPTVQRCVERGLITETFEEIRVLGENVGDVMIKDFKIPKNAEINFLNNKTPKVVQKMVTPMITPKPVVRLKECVGCGKCAEVCPAKTIEMIDKKPVIRLEDCIRCYCCHELCPKKVIDVKRPFIYKLGTKKKS